MDTITPISKKKTDKKVIGLFVVLAIALVAAFLWWWNYNKYISTDDANLDSFRVNVASRVMAPIQTLYVWEGDTVKTGEILAELDSSNAKVQLQEAVSLREQRIANLQLNKENLQTVRANLKLAEIAFAQAEVNFQRAQTQYNGQAISLESLQNTEEVYKIARAKVDVAKKQIDVARAQITTDEAAIATADASIEAARVLLSYYRITAPTNGVIAKRWALPGDIIQPGQTLFTINQGTNIWVSVYLEETRFQHIRMGQPAIFTLDAYPDLTFLGKVFYIGSNAASEFALIPPNNASGNYTKVAQRIPLKISVEAVTGNNPMPQLVSGMSANVKIEKEK